MKKTFTIIILFLVCGGVFGDPDKVKSVTVTAGDSVTLHTNITKIHEDDVIWWRFGEGKSKSLLVEIAISKILYASGRFRDKLQISDSKIGDLTIMNMKIKYSGLYEAEINIDTGTVYKRFNVTVIESPPVINAGPSEVASFTVKEGESVSLPCNVQTQRDALIVWRFGDERALIAEVDMEDDMISLFDGTDGSFKDRLKLNGQTGDLTITNSKPEHSGVYQLKISSNTQTLYKTFSVIVRGAGLSSGGIAGLIFFFLLIIAAVIAAGWILYRRRVSELQYEMEIVSVIEGNSATLKTEITEYDPKDHEIIWRFGDNDHMIAQNHKKTNDVSYVDDERFKNKLHLNKKTGDLTITDIRIRNSGDYHMKITSRTRINRITKYKTFKVVVHETLNVTEGESVELQTGISELQDDDQIQWRSETKDVMIAVRNGKSNDEISINCDDDEMFKNRLTLNNQTGSLIITNIKNSDSGVYELQIKNQNITSYKKFSFLVEQKWTEMSVMEGESVRLPTDLTDIQIDDQILWMFGPEDNLIAKFQKKNGWIAADEKKTLYDVVEGRFKNKLDLDQTGSLTIRHINTELTGLYKLQIIRNGENTYKKYKVSLYDYTLKHTVGDSVTLKTGVFELKDDHQILWTFGNKNTRIAEINRVSGRLYVYDDNDERFGDRLTLNELNGDLTIRNIMRGHSGVYKLRINNRSESKCKSFMLTVNEKWTEMSVKEGESVRLSTDLTHIHNDDQILWMFGPEDSLIAKFHKKWSWKIISYDEKKMLYDGVDGRFKNKLQLNQTGSLTIRDINTELTGLYKLQIIRNGENTYKKYKVYVDGEILKSFT
ncbi:uncharacterized protein [Paramisgurnus dabryanus]|uniref:uncharacterized protein n=1 Tax=Paramisgurnus dabryanus TaxID=90735 RepID=UPI003CCF277F